PEGMLLAEGPGDREQSPGPGLRVGWPTAIAGPEGRLAAAAEPLHEAADRARGEVQFLGDLGGGLAEPAPPPDHGTDRVGDRTWHGTHSGRDERRVWPPVIIAAKPVSRPAVQLPVASHPRGHAGLGIHAHEDVGMPPETIGHTKKAQANVAPAD